MIRTSQTLLLCYLDIFGGFFSSLPMASSLVQEDSGGKSLFTALASSSFLLVVLIWIGPIFEPLPVCILASIILASLKGVIQKIGDFKKYWDRSRWDGFVWLVTFLSTVLIDVDMGLLVGIGASIMAVMARGCIPEVVVLQQNPSGEAWLDRRMYKTRKNGPKVMQVSGPIQFVTSGYLGLQITREMGSIQNCVELTQVVATSGDINDSGILDVSNLDTDNCEKDGNQNIVLDLSQVPFIDVNGTKIIQRVAEQIVKGGGKVAISGANHTVAMVLNKANVMENIEDLMYPTYMDAVAFW